MKTIILLLLIGLSLKSAAQAPNQFNYQAVARNTLGQNIPNANIKLRLMILDGGPSGTSVYSETRQTTTNQMGLFTAAIGGPGASSTTGNFATINWSTGKKYIQVEVDPLGGNSFTVLGNTEMLSVPYALYAVNGAPGVPGPGNTLKIGTVTTGVSAAANITGSSPLQTLNLTLPAGAMGPIGPAGPAGVAGTIGPVGPQGTAGKSSLIKTTVEAAGSNCATGGVKQEYGVDANSNGLLDPSEIEPLLTKYICNGLAGAVTNAWGLAGNAGTTTANFIGTTDANPLNLATGNLTRLTISANGNTGIGTSSPISKLDVQTLNNSYGISHTGEGGNVLATRMGGTSAGIGTFSNTNMRIFANGNSAMFINSGNSNVGIGVDFPTNKLQIGAMGNTAYAENNFAFGNGVDATRMYQAPSQTVIASSAHMLFLPKEGSGFVGVNCSSVPTNKFQIGDVGSSGFAGNDLAIGNGTNAVAIYQNNLRTLIGSTTDIVLKPRNNGAGRVGINTNTPRAPLDVIDFADVPDEGGAKYVNYSYLALIFRNFNPEESIGGTIQSFYPRVSIFASGRIVATEFDANSDARIKNIAGVSNPAKDLETINALHITDYTMKDRVKYGNKTFKKVIAQEVEKVYPQVISKHKDFIPNVYQVTNAVKQMPNAYLLGFANDHHISKDAKKLQIIMEGTGMQQFDIVSIPSANQVVITATDIKSDKLFVYGEEVDDFRTVDYEGLTTLNISATQELSNLVKKQQAAIELQNQKIAELTEKIKLLQNKQ